MKIHRMVGWACAVAVLAASGSALSFQVLPKVSDVDRKLAGLGSNRWLDIAGQLVMRDALPMIKNPVHEAITLAAVGCPSPAGDEEDCVIIDAVRKNRILLYGVRWPDDPPFALSRDKPPRSSRCDPAVTLRSTAQPKCWLDLFNDAGVAAKAAAKKSPGKPAFGPGDYLLYRSHYGDLQFFHSMAAYDGELAAVTHARMRMWAGFLWGVAVRQVPTDQYIRNLGFADLSPYFPGDMTVMNLFATGIQEVREDLDKVALGALLHMTQDSFSQAHADRQPEMGGRCPQLPRFAKPGKVARFYSYARQVGKDHDREDTFRSLGLQTVQSTPNVVEVSNAFLALWNEKASWDEAGKYFDCVFDLQDPMAEAGPGRFAAEP